MAEPSEKAGGLSDALPTDALKDAGQKLLGLVLQRAAQAATERVGGLSDRLSGVADNGGTGLKSALGMGGNDDDDEDDEDSDGEGGKKGLFSRAFGGIKDKVKETFGGGGGTGGSGKKLKVTVISEDLDIGLPLRTTYDLWTQYGDFPGFMKKLETVDQESDEKTNWKAQVLWSHRTWEATTVEQVPDSHIVWKSKGAKGHVDGTVTFTEIGSNLTRVMLVLEYWPKGLFERTGNLWRAQGRRARLEFQHFRRHAMTNAMLRQDEIEGWRGEIRDSEVVKTHEEALEEEEQQAEETSESEDGAAEDEALEDEAADDEAADDEAEPDEDIADDEADEREPDDEYVEEDADEEYADEEDADEPEEAAEAPAEDEYDDEYEDESESESEAEEEPDEEAASGNGSSRRRQPVGARSRRGR
jgi:hypothetical protein